MNSRHQLLPSNIDIEFNKIDYWWHQGQTAFTDAQKSAIKIFKLLKLASGSSLSVKDISKIMMIKLGHLNGISTWKLKIFIRGEMN